MNTGLARCLCKSKKDQGEQRIERLTSTATQRSIGGTCIQNGNTHQWLTSWFSSQFYQSRLFVGIHLGPAIKRTKNVLYTSLRWNTSLVAVSRLPDRARPLTRGGKGSQAPDISAVRRAKAHRAPYWLVTPDH
ncbi:hypothetical protein PAXRUDRAFT_832001 [Paxillus rubicundulus Ve08.2h10]|uniref:Uncharacterized protein n=1 Tax=Paxillus rubicundulus Ve08.2h10 TaxID=930991 RepID=A0A0D0DHE1_9AGAM|nr:hypothetical protein PAXRUDRAFT_832001 [Paxillus rubicundulus Ve08.2h10]